MCFCCKIIPRICKRNGISPVSKTDSAIRHQAQKKLSKIVLKINLQYELQRLNKTPTNQMTYYIPNHTGSMLEIFSFSFSPLTSASIDWSVDLVFTTLRSVISKTGALKSSGPWANAQCGPFFVQLPLFSVSIMHRSVL